MNPIRNQKMRHIVFAIIMVFVLVASFWLGSRSGSSTHTVVAAPIPQVTGTQWKHTGRLVVSPAYVCDTYQNPARQHPYYRCQRKLSDGTWVRAESFRY